MTRWKREPRVVIRTMHAHNVYSEWHYALLDAAEQLGLPVGLRRSANHFDGSEDRRWYTAAAALDRVGGIERLQAVAEDLHDERVAGRAQHIGF